MTETKTDSRFYIIIMQGQRPHSVVCRFRWCSWNFL